jgi:hypothetical protein
LVLADALYAKAPFFNFLLARGKHALAMAGLQSEPEWMAQISSSVGQ